MSQHEAKARKGDPVAQKLWSLEFSIKKLKRQDRWRLKKRNSEAIAALKQLYVQMLVESNPSVRTYPGRAITDKDAP